MTNQAQNPKPQKKRHVSQKKFWKKPGLPQSGKGLPSYKGMLEANPFADWGTPALEISIHELSALRAGFGKPPIIKEDQIGRQGFRSQLVDKCHDVVALVNLSFTIHNSQFGVNNQL